MLTSGSIFASSERQPIGLKERTASQDALEQSNQSNLAADLKRLKAETDANLEKIHDQQAETVAMLANHALQNQQIVTVLTKIIESLSQFENKLNAFKSRLDNQSNK